MDNYLKKMFIDEAKPALNRHSGSGGNSGGGSTLQVVEFETSNYVFNEEKTLSQGNYSSYDVLDNDFLEKLWELRSIDNLLNVKLIQETNQEDWTVRALAGCNSIYYENEPDGDGLWEMQEISFYVEPQLGKASGGEWEYHNIIYTFNIQKYEGEYTGEITLSAPGRAIPDNSVLKIQYITY